MPVFVIVQVEIVDPKIYARYTTRFMQVFEKFDGRLLVNDEAPQVLEGKWNLDKVVVLSFPNKEAFTAWATSPEYLEIMQDRLAGAKATILLTQGLDV